MGDTGTDLLFRNNSINNLSFVISLEGTEKQRGGVCVGQEICKFVLVVQHWLTYTGSSEKEKMSAKRADKEAVSQECNLISRQHGSRRQRCSETEGSHVLVPPAWYYTHNSVKYDSRANVTV